MAFTGCSVFRPRPTEASIRAASSKVNVSDGINKHEAKTIAQAYLLEHPADGNLKIHKPSVSLVKYRQEGKPLETYVVSFNYENLSFMNPYYWVVRVDPKTGTVLGSRSASHK